MDWEAASNKLQSNSLIQAEKAILMYDPDSQSHNATTSSKLKKRIAVVFKKINLKAIFAPSTTGAVVGFAIGVIPQIRNLLIGDGAPLRVIQDTAYLLGDGSIPALTLIIGGNLLKGRAGRKGCAITFVSGEDARYAPDLVQALELSEQVVPDDLICQES